MFCVCTSCVKHNIDANLKANLNCDSEWNNTHGSPARVLIWSVKSGALSHSSPPHLLYMSISTVLGIQAIHGVVDTHAFIYHASRDGMPYNQPILMMLGHLTTASDLWPINEAKFTNGSRAPSTRRPHPHGHAQPRSPWIG